MKSIVEEASSIAKAVEKGWVRAGKPQEFSVKIFEEPEKNFFGLTTKPAKIALVFAQAPSTAKPAHEKEQQQRRHPRDTERRPSTQEPRSQERRERHTERRDDRQDDRQDRRHERQDRQERHGRNDRHERRPARDHQSQQPREHRERDRSEQREQREQRPHDREQSHQQQPRQQHADSGKTWEQPAVSFAQTWITECLTHLGLPNVTAQLTTSGNTLTIQLGSPIADNGKNERFFLSSLSHLLSEALRTQLKLDMRGLRIMIHSNN